MNNTEQYLENFKLKDPPPNLKKSILVHAEAHWLQQDADNIPSGLTTAVKIVFYSAAAAIVLMLSAAFFNIPEQTDDINQDSEELALLVDIGFSRKAATQIILLEKFKKCQDNINLKILTKEI